MQIDLGNANYITRYNKIVTAKQHKYRGKNELTGNLAARALYPGIPGIRSHGPPAPGKITIGPRPLPPLLVLPGVGPLPHDGPAPPLQPGDPTTAVTLSTPRPVWPAPPPCALSYDPGNGWFDRVGYGPPPPPGATQTRIGTRYVPLDSLRAAALTGWPPLTRVIYASDPDAPHGVTYPTATGLLVHHLRPGAPPTWRFIPLAVAASDPAARPAHIYAAEQLAALPERMTRYAAMTLDP